MKESASQDWISISLPAELHIANDGLSGMRCDSALLERDDQQGLKLTVMGEGEGPSHDDAEAGKEAKSVRLELGTADHRDAIGDGFCPASTRARWTPSASQATVSGPLRSLEIKTANGEPAIVVEWVCHAPSAVDWPRPTETIHKMTYRRTRGDETLDLPLSKSRTFGRDHVCLELGLPTLSKLRFGVVDANNVEAASSTPRPGFVQFNAGPNGIADSDLRYTVRFGLNFLFGCGLGLLGVSEFDSSHQELRCELVSGFSPGGHREAPPLRMHASKPNAVDEGFCAEFLRRYVKHAATYDLNRVVWLLRYSLRAPVDMAAAYAGAAFEVLRTRYYAQEKNEARSTKLPRAEFRALRSAMEALIKERSSPGGQPLPNASAYDAVRNALDGLNNISGTRLNVQLLNDLGLVHGDAEKQALQARNDAAHGNPFAPDDASVWLARVDALRTLASRALVAVLEMRPTGYIDYGSSGRSAFPGRGWDQPQQLRSPG